LTVSFPPLAHLQAIIATLIEAGGSMRSRDAEGRTPLHMAAESSAVATAVFIDRVRGLQAWLFILLLFER